MIGVLGQLFRPQKRTVEHCTSRVDPKAMELETVKEILTEVFRVRVSKVDEMIQNRFKATCYVDIGSKEEVLWPQEFWLEGGTAWFGNWSQDLSLFRLSISRSWVKVTENQHENRIPGVH